MCLSLVFFFPPLFWRFWFPSLITSRSRITPPPNIQSTTESINWASRTVPIAVGDSFSSWRRMINGFKDLLTCFWMYITAHCTNTSWLKKHAFLLAFRAWPCMAFFLLKQILHSTTHVQKLFEFCICIFSFRCGISGNSSMHCNFTT